VSTIKIKDLSSKAGFLSRAVVVQEGRDCASSYALNS
jgi:hypothetical protein